MMDIKIDGHLLGTVDVSALTIGAQMDLEDANSVRALIRWLVDYAGADEQAVRAALRPLPAQEIASLIESISKALAGAVSVPKASASR